MMGTRAWARALAVTSLAALLSAVPLSAQSTAKKRTPPSAPSSGTAQKRKPPEPSGPYSRYVYPQYPYRFIFPPPGCVTTDLEGYPHCLSDADAAWRIDATWRCTAMRTDKELQESVVKALDEELSVNAAQIGVTVQQGVITLTGRVGALREKWMAEKAARHVWGVRAVANDLAVAPEASVGTDTAIASAAVSALDWNSAIPPELIQVTVRDGWVTLNGTVPWHYQKAAAEKAIEHLHGVKGVANAIVVKAPVTATVVRHKIEEAFKRSADVDARRVSVETHNGTVVLKGTVHSLTERAAAERAAWAAPGVIAIDDQLIVEP